MDHDVVPGIIFLPTRDSSWDPLLVYIVVNVPLVTTSNAAFMSPYERMPARELIDVKFDSLRVGHAGRVEIYVVDEIVHVVCNLVL